MIFNDTNNDDSQASWLDYRSYAGATFTTAILLLNFFYFSFFEMLYIFFLTLVKSMSNLYVTFYYYEGFYLCFAFFWVALISYLDFNTYLLN
jgi:hypothetical protein